MLAENNSGHLAQQVRASGEYPFIAPHTHEHCELWELSGGGAGQATFNVRPVAFDLLSQFLYGLEDRGCCGGEVAA